MENITKLIAGIGSLILLVVISLAIVSYASDVQTTVSTTGAFDTNFSYNNSAITIDAKNGITAIDVIKYNQTWLEFNSTTDKVTLTDNADLRFDTYNWTLSFWINSTNNSNNALPRLFEKAPHIIVLMGDPANGKHNKIGVELVNQTDSSVASEWWSDKNLTENKWVHVVIVSNATNHSIGNISFWFNGIENSTSMININGGVDIVRDTIGDN